MNPAFLIKLHPAGPWRFGPGEGGREGVDHLYRSDRLFSALAIAFEQLGLLDGWLDATVRAASPKVVFSSLFPFQGDTLFAPPPATVWPPPTAALRVSSPVFATKVRWSAARFAPLSLIETLLLSQRLLADQWLTDPESACLLRRDRPQSSPYRTATRTQAAIDRMSKSYEPHSLGCIEFESGSGLWTLAAFEDGEAAEEWKDRIRAALRLLADTGFGGRRSSGWGQVSKTEIAEGTWPGLLFPKLGRRKLDDAPANGGGAAEHWLLSLFVPSEADKIDWANGSYSATTRGGYVESRSGAGRSKRLLRMITEGSVLASANKLRGCAVDVAPEGLGHAVYRAGFALSLTLPRIDYSGFPEEPVSEGTELEAALNAALRSAAEEDVASIAEETAEEKVKEFEKAAEELAEAEPAKPAPEARTEEPPPAEEPPSAEQQAPAEQQASNAEEPAAPESESEVTGTEEPAPEPVPQEPVDETPKDTAENTEDENGHEI